MNFFNKIFGIEKKKKSLKDDVFNYIYNKLNVPPTNSIGYCVSTNYYEFSSNTIAMFRSRIKNILLLELKIKSFLAPKKKIKSYLSSCVEEVAKDVLAQCPNESPDDCIEKAKILSKYYELLKTNIDKLIKEKKSSISSQKDIA